MTSGFISLNTICWLSYKFSFSTNNSMKIYDKTFSTNLALIPRNIKHLYLLSYEHSIYNHLFYDYTISKRHQNISRYITTLTVIYFCFNCSNYPYGLRKLNTKFLMVNTKTPYKCKTTRIYYNHPKLKFALL